MLTPPLSLLTDAQMIRSPTSEPLERSVWKFDFERVASCTHALDGCGHSVLAEVLIAKAPSQRRFSVLNQELSLHVFLLLLVISDIHVHLEEAWLVFHNLVRAVVLPRRAADLSAVASARWV